MPPTYYAAVRFAAAGANWTTRLPFLAVPAFTATVFAPAEGLAEEFLTLLLSEQLYHIPHGQGMLLGSLGPDCAQLFNFRCNLAVLGTVLDQRMQLIAQLNHFVAVRPHELALLKLDLVDLLMLFLC